MIRKVSSLEQVKSEPSTPITSERKLNVLVSAFSCWPNSGSEPAVGWNWARQAALHDSVWVLTVGESRESIERHRHEWEHLDLHFVYWDPPFWPKRFRPGLRCLRLYYIVWQISVLPFAFNLYRDVKFDIVHHVTMISIEMPGLLWVLPTKFVWGPVGGGQVPPTTLRRYFGWRWIFEIARSLRKNLTLISPIVRLAAKKASYIVAANKETEELLRRCGARNIIRHSELTAPVHVQCAKSRRSAKRETLTVLWAGSLIHRKSPALALDVIAATKRRGVPVRLLVAGDGPLRRRIQTHASSLNLESEVEFLGALPYKTMPAFYEKGDVFLFTSLQDTGGTVLLEAMAHSLPIVSIDHQGVSELVDQHTGIKVPAHSETQVINGLADGLAMLYQNCDLRHTMARAAARRVEDVFSFERRASFLQDLYRRAIHGSQWTK